jgi:hypothetical protein
MLTQTLPAFGHMKIAWIQLMSSCTGYVLKLADCPIVWGSRLQLEIALLTMEAEYVALSMTMREVLPFKALVEAVAVAVGFGKFESTTFCTTVWEDNMGALTLANMEPGRHTPRSKHFTQSSCIGSDLSSTQTTFGFVISVLMSNRLTS